ncbi:glycoside hydrolase family 3 protein, partial [Aureobasidium melanogenum]
MHHHLNTIAVTLAAIGLAGAQNSSWNHNLFTSSPPVYPSPETAGIGWEAALAQAEAFLANLTLEEKAGMVTGCSGPCVGNIAPIERLGFDGLCLQDGPLAIRQATYASVFSAGLTTAASWDKGLMYTRGLYMGQEFRGKGANVALGPVVGPLGRNARGGRNWEGFSPDPFLTGIAVEQTIWGMQSTGLQACVKHYIGNEQETQRNPSVTKNGTTIEAVSSNIDDRTMHELYSWPFANAVRSGVASVMCSYNRVNGSYSCENSKTLNGILKEEFGFQGYVMSDWGGTHSGVPSINAGLDMDMPGTIGFFVSDNSYFGSNITTAVNNGSLSEARLDDMIKRIMTPYFHLKQNIDYPPIDPSGAIGGFFSVEPTTVQFPLGTVANVDVRANHATLIRELGSAGTVLLKNVNNALPLKVPKNIAVLGNDAGDLINGEYFDSSPYSQNAFGFEYGTLPVGGGSGTGRMSYLVDPLTAIKARAAQDGSLVQWILNNTLLSTPSGLSSLAPSPPDVCLVFLKTWAQEGLDRSTLLADWNSTAVVESVTSVCNNTIVVTHSGGLNVMPWANNPNVTAILAAHLPGTESGNSLVDILYGDVNPSGRLPYTIAKTQEDYSFADITNSTALATTTNPNAWQSDFEEGLLIDYRHFDYYNQSVQYEFGFGLSYSTFDISSLSVSNVYGGSNITSTPPPAKIIPGGNPTLWDVLYRATVTVSNTGDIAGATVPQLYLSLPQIPGEDPTPLHVLRGFEKVSLQSGQSTVVNFDLTRRDLSYWSVFQQEWVIAAGEIGVSVGLSSRDFKATSSFRVL